MHFFFFFFCCCCHCVSPIRTYIVQKQAQEQELFPPVKWVWVQSIVIFSHPGSSQKKDQTKKVIGVFASCSLWAVCELSHFFLLPLCLSPVSYNFVGGNCSQLGTQFDRSNSSVLSIEGSMAFCVDTRESCMRGATSLFLMLKIAWGTRLFLVGDTGKLGKHLHNGTPPLSDPYFYQA